MWKRNPRNKYGNAMAGGSKLEEAVYVLLKEREKKGEISDLKRQQTVSLSAAKIRYRADFKYVLTETGEFEWAEAKGFEQDVWKLKKKLWLSYGPGRLLIYKGTYRRPFLEEELIPNQKTLTCPGCGAEVEDEKL